MRTWMLVALAAGCSGESTTNPEKPAGATPSSASPDGDLLAKGPPAELGPVGKVMERVAGNYGVGLVRCPLAGGGRARQVYGTERDRLFDMGPIWEMEWDPATAPPWDPLFDEVTSEDGWLTMLAVPGTTRGWVSTRAKTLSYEFPPSVAGTTVVCTAVHDAPSRTIRGTVTSPAGAIPAGTLIVPCISPPPKVPGDGTFLGTVQTPCTLWAEGPLMRSDKVRVDEGTEPVELAFTLARDPQQNDDLTWSPEGRSEVEATFSAQQTRYAATSAILNELAAVFESNPEAKIKIQRWVFDYTAWGRSVDASIARLDAPPLTPPGPPKVPPPPQR